MNSSLIRVFQPGRVNNELHRSYMSVSSVLVGTKNLPTKLVHTRANKPSDSGRKPSVIYIFYIGI